MFAQVIYLLSSPLSFRVFVYLVVWRKVQASAGLWRVGRGVAQSCCRDDWRQLILLNPSFYNPHTSRDLFTIWTAHNNAHALRLEKASVDMTGLQLVLAACHCRMSRRGLARQPLVCLVSSDDNDDKIISNEPLMLVYLEGINLGWRLRTLLFWRCFCNAFSLALHCSFGLMSIIRI